MKDKKYKYVEDLIEEYIDLTAEQIELPLLIDRAKEKHEALKLGESGSVVEDDDAEDAFKVFMQLKKCDEHKIEINERLAEVEGLLSEFLLFLNGGKLSYEKKDDNKNKLTFLFWIEDGKLKCNR